VEVQASIHISQEASNPRIPHESSTASRTSTANAELNRTSSPEVGFTVFDFSGWRIKLNWGYHKGCHMNDDREAQVLHSIRKYSK
jgi:hypothetical protein